MSTARISRHFLFVLVACAPLLMGGACEKKTGKPSDTGAISAMDRSSGSAGIAPSNDTSPLQGIDLTVLAKDKQDVFYRLVNSLKSPCGKPESLRASYAKDTACKRAPYAVRYIVALLDDEATEDIVREEYTKKYETQSQAVRLDPSKAPRIGNDDAQVRLVEFFDYACPHCREFAPMLEQVAKEHQANVVVYYMMFPLGKWPDSKTAAQAAIAAHQQGKFKEMHALLFQRAPAHGKTEVTSYAKSIGLDMAKFEAAFAAAGAQVEGDKAQGDAAGVESTPTLYFNDRKYEGPLNPKYIGMWIAEEVAVNR